MSLRACSCLALAVLLSGCASSQPPGIFDLGTGPVNADGQREVKKMIWPPAESGDPPRYAYAGELLGEQNFRPPKKSGATFGQYFVGALQWLVGLYDSGRTPVILQRPQAGVVDNESKRILVTDSSRKAVFVFDQLKGRLEVWENATSHVPFTSPSGIALGMAGETYVADAELGYVTRLNNKGESLSVLGKGVLKRPAGLAFDAIARQLYVADVHAHDIKVFSADGPLLRTLGQRGEAPGEFNFPTYLTLAQGELYVTDTMNARIQAIDPNSGMSKRVISERGLNMGNLVRPKGVAVDTEGNVYVVESYHDYLLVFNRNGEFLLPIGGTGAGIGQFYLPAGVWTDASNRIYVADMFNGRVVVFQFLGNSIQNSSQ